MSQEGNSAEMQVIAEFEAARAEFRVLFELFGRTLLAATGRQVNFPYEGKIGSSLGRFSEPHWIVVGEDDQNGCYGVRIKVGIYLKLCYLCGSRASNIHAVLYNALVPHSRKGTYSNVSNGCYDDLCTVLPNSHSCGPHFRAEFG